MLLFLHLNHQKSLVTQKYPLWNETSKFKNKPMKKCVHLVLREVSRKFPRVSRHKYHSL